MKKMIKCPACNVIGEVYVKCPKCEEEGHYLGKVCWDDPKERWGKKDICGVVFEVCMRCKGKGEVAIKCQRCRGTRRIYE